MNVTKPFYSWSLIVILEVVIILIRDEEAEAQMEVLGPSPALHGPRGFLERAELEGGVGALKG